MMLDNYVPFEETDAYRNLQDLSDQWQAEDADERAALESAIGKILEWQEQVVRENQQAAELLPLRAQLELARAPARARTRELQCGDSD